MTAAGWEVIGRAGIYIARLGDTEITGSVAGWLLRSVERDLVDDCRRARRARYDLAVDDPTGDTAPLSRRHGAGSAEDAAFAGPLVWGAVADAARRGALSSASARVVLLHAAGHSFPELARRAGTSRASVYRLRDRGHAQLRDELAIAS
jgi:DNA-directed RNA polymerase specialized sigma24 family protein